MTEGCSSVDSNKEQMLSAKIASGLVGRLSSLKHNVSALRTAHQQELYLKPEFTNEQGSERPVVTTFHIYSASHSDIGSQMRA
jgi:hypothetical protein